MQRLITISKSVLLGTITTLLCSWFLVHTSAFAAAVQSRLDSKHPSPITFERFEINPSFDRITAYNVALYDRSGQPQLVAAYVQAEVDLAAFEFGAAGVHLPVRTLYITDFELALVWNRVGKLRLTEGFVGRTIDVTETQPPPKKPFSLELSDIVLRHGTLNMEWEASGFGFRFTEVEGDGSIAIAPGTFQMHVGALGSKDSALWFTKDAERFRERFATFPANGASKACSGAVLPFNSVLFEDFDWEARQFDSKLSIQSSDGSTARVMGSMGFERGKPPAYEFVVDIDLLKNMVAALSNGRVAGSLMANVHTKRQGKKASLEVRNTSLERLQIGATRLADPIIRRLRLTGEGDSLGIDMDGSVSKIEHGQLAIEELDVMASVNASWPTLSAATLLRGRFSPPSVASLLQANARVELKRASARRLQWENSAVEKAEVHDLKLTAKLPNVSAEISRIEAQEFGSAAVSMEGRVSLGITGISIPTAISVEATDIPTSGLKQLKKRDAIVWPEGTFSGRIGVDIDMYAPASAVVKSVVAR